MKFRLNILLTIFLVTGNLTVLCVNGKDAIGKYHEANIAYQKLDYQKCIQLYEELIKSKSESVEVYYNLGNAYFKSGNFAKAILNYERAKKLNPDDEDVNFNLKIASLKVVDKIDNVPEIFYKRWINNLALLLPSDSWATLLIILVWLVFVFAVFYIISSSVAGKKISFLLIIISICFVAATGLIASKSHAITNLDEQAVIMASSVYIKSSPDEKGNDQFILHEGTRVDVIDELNDWKKIRIANGSIGWMKAEDMEKI